MKRITLILLLCLFFVSGCNIEPQKSINICKNETITDTEPCAFEKCFMSRSTGMIDEIKESARASYFQCMYLHLLAKEISRGFKQCQTS